MREEEFKVKAIDRKRNGYSLIEALVVLGIMAMILLIVMPFFYRMLQAYRTQTAATLMATNLRFARNAAVKQKVKYRFTFQDEGAVSPNTYYVERDTSGSGSYSTYEEMDTDFPDGIKIDSTSTDTITFDSRGGAILSPTSTVILIEGPNDLNFQINISLTGAISVEKV